MIPKYQPVDDRPLAVLIEAGCNGRTLIEIIIGFFFRSQRAAFQKWDRLL
jgi:hypothetical protein